MVVRSAGSASGRRSRTSRWYASGSATTRQVWNACRPGENPALPYFQPGGKPITKKGGRFNWWGRDPAWTDTLGIRDKFNVDPLVEFATPISNQQRAGYLTVDNDEVVLTRKGLLQFDSLLTEYFEEQHREVRYT